MIRLVVIAAALLAVLALQFGQASADSPHSITLVSGNGAVGANDPLHTVSTDGGLTWSPAYITGQNTQHYAKISGTDWISCGDTAHGNPANDQCAIGSTTAGKYTYFRAPFYLPPGASSQSMDISVYSDNAASFSLNGNQIGSQTGYGTCLGGACPATNWGGTADTFSTSNPLHFITGTNWLQIGLWDSSGIAGLDYKATVKFNAPHLELSPASATNVIGDSHQLTAEFEFDAAPSPGTNVRFDVVSGPNAGLHIGSDVTNGAGVATESYISTAHGTDTIVAKTIPASSPITLVSGNGAVGTNDPIHTVSTDGGLTWFPAYITGQNTQHYAKIPGTDWISCGDTAHGNPANDQCAIGSTTAGKYTHFRVPFTLPTGASNPSIDISVYSDNAAEFRLNGDLIGAQTGYGTCLGGACPATNWGGTADTFSTSNPLHFNAGVNWLQIGLWDSSGIAGLDYKAVVNFTPLPPVVSNSVKKTWLAPPKANAGGPYPVVEGTVTPITGAASSDADGVIMSYTWDLDNDGLFDDAAGVNPVFSAVGRDGPSTQLIRLRVVDNHGLSDVATTVVNISNAAPVVASGAVDLNDWNQEFALASGNWTVSGAGDTVFQSINGNPTAFIGDFDAFGTALNGAIRVDLPPPGHFVDDDFVGFVLGFDPGDGSNPSADYLLVDWKRFNQGSGEAGLAVSRVTGTPSTINFWNHNGGVNELAEAITLGSTGWNYGTNYNFAFEYDATRLKVLVNGNLELDVAAPAGNPFPNGKFGFYNFSQSRVTYSSFQSDAIVGVEGSPVGLSKDFTDLGTPDTHTAQVNWGDGGGFLPASVAQGAGSGTVNGNHTYADDGVYTVTVKVTDDDGGVHTDTLTANIANIPPLLEIDGDKTAYWVDWTSAPAGTGTASGTITLGDGSTIGVEFAASGSSTLHDSETHTGSGTDWWNHPNVPASTFESTEVPNRPDYTDVIALVGNPGTTYTVTLSEPIVDPIMAILSLGSPSITTRYDFDTPFDIVSQGKGPWGGHGSSLVELSGNKLQGKEGSGTLKFDGTYSTFSWTVPVGETWHGFTFAARSSAALAETVFVDEGEVANNYGTWDDVPADRPDVQLSASVGSITKNNNGTWSWSFPTTDGPPDTQVVTLTANDQDGGITNKSFPLVVNNVAPTILETTHQVAPIPEGSTFTNGNLVVHASDPAGSNDPLAFAFDCDNNGSYEKSAYPGTSATDCHYNDDGSFTVGLRVSDGDGGVTFGSMTAVVTNVDPQVQANISPAVIIENGSVLVTGSYSDAGKDDTHTATIAWGDGTIEPLALSPTTPGAGTFAATHVYLDDGFSPGNGTASDGYGIAITVTDDDGGIGNAAGAVTVNNVDPVLGTGKIVVNNDEWTFSNSGFAADPASATAFVENVADYFNGGAPGNFLAYSSNFGLTESSLASAMTGAGHAWTVSTAVPFNVASLLAYDGVFVGGHVGGSYPDQQVLIDYVNAGGNVYVAAGTGHGGAAAEAAGWNTFLNTFGLNLASVYNGVDGSPAPASSHPLLAGVDSLYFFLGNSVNVLPSPPIGQVLFDLDGHGMLAVAAIGSVSANSIDENGVASLSASFTDPGTLDVHKVTINWGDGSGVDVLTLPVGARSFSATHQYLDDGVSPGNGTASDNYTIGITVVDDDLGSDTESTAITVTNVDPVITSITGDTINENGLATVSGAFSDPGSLDIHAVEINWGDGSSSAASVDQVNHTFTASHVYLDDNPSGTNSDTYAVGAKITDDDTGSGTAGTSVTVNNVDPVITSISGDTINENGVATVSGTFSDVGALDTHGVEINWGDGSSSAATVDQVNDTFTANHVYLDDGLTPGGSPSHTYTATATLTDDDTGSDDATAGVTVNNVDPAITSFTGDTILENGEATVSGTFSDVGTLDTHGVVIVWGDGSSSPATVDQANDTFTAKHVYLDDGLTPGGSPSHTYTATAILTDDDTGSDDATVGVTVNNVDPVITSISGDTIDENGVATVSGTFSDVGTQDTHGVMINWGDGSSSAALVDQVNDTFTATHPYPDDSPSGTDSDTYAITATLTDDDTGSDVAGTSVTVDNVNPEITSVSQSATSINENDSLTVSGTFSDVGTQDTHGVVINWGDGSSSEAVVTQGAGSGSFTATHQYLDDHPTTGTPSDLLPITVTLTDDDTGSDVAGTSVTVNNLDPELDGPIDQIAISVGGTVNLDIDFSDVGTLDTHTATVDWDEGAGPVAASVAEVAGSGTITSSETFDDPGVYVVTVVVTDDDTGSDSLTFIVTVLEIDYKPTSEIDPLELNGNGVVPIAVMGGFRFDVTQLDPSTVLAGYTGKETAPRHEGGHIEDVDGDGYLDYMFHFRQYALEVPLTTPAWEIIPIYLTVSNTDGLFFIGEDDVRINPNNDNSKGKGGDDAEDLGAEDAGGDDSGNNGKGKAKGKNK